MTSVRRSKAKVLTMTSLAGVRVLLTNVVEAAVPDPDDQSAVPVGRLLTC